MIMARANPHSVDLLICGLCNKQLSHPKLLPCQHSFCKDCLKNEALGPDFTLSCPSCERTVKLENGETEQLPYNFLFTILQEQKGLFENKKGDCLSCQFENVEAEASHKCLDCGDLMCADCKRFHSRTSQTRNHKVVALKDIQEGKFKDKLKQKRILCLTHSSDNEQIDCKFYCNHCQTLVCQHCVILEHKSHTCSTIDTVDEKGRLNLSCALKPLDEKEKRAIEYLQHLDNMSQALQTETVVIEDQVFKSADAIYALVDKLKEEKLKDIKNKNAKEMKHIEKVRHQHSLLLDQTKTLKHFTEAFLEHSSKVDFVNHSKEVESRVQACVIVKEDFTITTRHLTIANKPCNYAKNSIKEILGDVSCIEKTTDKNGKEVAEWKEILLPPKVIFQIQTEMSIYGLSVSSENDIIAVGGSKIGVFSHGGLFQKWIQCQSVKKAWDVSIRNKQIYVVDRAKENKKVLVIDLEGALIKTITIPQNEQIHGGGMLGIVVDDRGYTYIASPETHTVYRCSAESTTLVPFLTKMSKPGLEGPCYLCMTQYEELVVSNQASHTIQVYNEQAALLWQYGGGCTKESLELNYPQGVCCDEMGNVYVADYHNHRIKIIKKGSLVGSIKLKDLQCPIGVAVNGNQELVISSKKMIMKVQCWK